MEKLWIILRLYGGEGIRHHQNVSLARTCTHTHLLWVDSSLASPGDFMKNLGDESQSHNFNLKIWVKTNIFENMNMNMETEETSHKKYVSYRSEIDGIIRLFSGIPWHPGRAIPQLKISCFAKLNFPNGWIMCTSDAYSIFCINVDCHISWKNSTNDELITYIIYTHTHLIHLHEWKDAFLLC